MVQTIQINNLRLKDNLLTIDLEFRFKSKENHTPRLQIIFYNEIEDRRFPLNELVFNKDSNDEYFVSSHRSFQLNHVFLNKNFTGDVFIGFSLLFGEEFIEEFSVDKASDFDNQSENYTLELVTSSQSNEGPVSKIVLKSNTDKLNKIVNNRKKYKPLLLVDRFFLIILAILSFPFFLIEGFLASKGVVEKSTYYLKGDSTFKSILFHVNWRTNIYAEFIYGRRTLNISIIQFFYFFSKFRKIKNNKITFLSERREDLSGNFEFVHDLLNNNKDLKIVKFLKNKPIRDLNFREMIKFANIIATSKIILLDDFYPNIHNFNLKNGVELIQLWHAVGAFKTFGFSRLGKP